MRIYAAFAYRGSHEDRRWYERILKVLRRHGDVLSESLREPIGATLGDKPKNVAVYERDARWIKSADYVVAEVTVPSHEVGYEIGLAEKLGKPVLCLLRREHFERLSPMIAGNAKLKIRQYESVHELESHVNHFLND